MPHAIVLAGSRGMGKKARARVLAAGYLGLPGEHALAGCPYYLETADPSVENVRNISRFVALQAFGRSRRCVVFFDAHKLSPQAQNALLKSLEEPPADTLFLLTGNEAGLLPTIRSRCMILRLGASPVDEVARELETEGVPQARARLAASLSGGVLGLAREYAGEEFTAFRAHVIAEIEKLLFGLPPYLSLATLLSGQAEGGGKKKSTVQPEPLRQFLAILSSLLRDALAEKEGSRDAVNTDKAALIEKFTSRFTFARIQRMIKRTLAAERHLQQNGNAGLVLDWLLAQLTIDN